MSKDITELAHWRSVWERALRNMPTKQICLTCKVCTVRFIEPNCPTCGIRVPNAGMLGLYGAQSALAKCLGYYSHHGVYQGWAAGSKPKGKRLEQLLKCAGPYGNIIAQLHLNKKPKLGWQMPRWAKFRHYSQCWRCCEDWLGFGFYQNIGPYTIHLELYNFRTFTVSENGYRYLRFDF